MTNWMTLATLIMAGTTVILACIAVWSILQNRRWNKRSERARVLPLLRLRPFSNSSTKVLSPGWPDIFFLKAKNIGMGPILTQFITAEQGNHKFISHLTVPTGSSISSSWFWETGEEKTLVFNLTNLPKDRPQGEAPPIKISAELYDLFGRAIQIDYEWLKFQKTRAIEVSAIKTDGKKLHIPSLASLMKKWSE